MSDHTRTTGSPRLSVSGPAFRSSLSPEPRRPLAGLRVLIADQDVVKVEALARAFRSHGALVEVSNFEPDAARLRHLRSFDPILVVADEARLVRSGATLVDRFRDDIILRWAHWFGSDWNQVWSETERTAKIENWLGAIQGFYLAEAEFSRLVRLAADFTMSASTLGPARILRRLARAAGIVRANLEATTTSAVVEMCDGQITGARTNFGKTGIDALAEVLTWRCASVEVRFAYELEFGDCMIRSAQALEQAVMRFVDSEEDMTILEDSRGAVAAALSEARREIERDTAATAALLEPGHESTLNGSTQPALPRTSPNLTKQRWLGMVAGVVAAGTAAGLLLLQLIPAPASGVPVVQGDAAPTRAPVELRGSAPAAPRAPTKAGANAPKPAVAPAPPPAGTRCDTVKLARVDQPGPRQAMREIYRGRRALVAGELKVAEQAFCTAAAIDPSGPMLQQLTKFYIERNDAGEALLWANRALEAMPTNTHAKLFRVDALALSGDETAARELLRVGPTRHGRSERPRGHPLYQRR